MKKKIITLFICVVASTCFSFSFAEDYDSIYLSKPLNAVKVHPVKVLTTPKVSGLTDSITLKIERINSIIPYETTFTRYVTEATDTTIYQLPGTYLVTWLDGGTNINNPKFVKTGLVSPWEQNIDGYLQYVYEIRYIDGVCGSTEYLDVLSSDENIISLKYKWTPSEGLSNDTIPNPIVKILGEITYKLEITTTDSVYTDSVTFGTTELVVTISPTNQTECGSTKYLGTVYTNYNGGGTLHYKWSPSTGLDSDTIRNPKCTIFEETSYTVTITTPEGCTATSNPKKVSIIKTSPPAIGIVTVNDKNQNLIAWNKTNGTTAREYVIYRETNVTDIYEKIGQCSNDSLSIFVDSTSNAEVKSAKYKLTMVDNCGAETDQSTAHKTMHLSINKGQNNNWNLIWEAYQGFVVQTYNIYRGSSANSLNYLASTSGSSTQYTDINAPTGDVFYQIEVVAPTTTTPTKIISSQNLASYNSSKSNIAFYSTSANSYLTTDIIQLYPNPVEDVLFINSPTPVQFEVYNCSGIRLLSSSSSELNQIIVKDWEAGIYFIRTRNNENVTVLKFIKK